MVLNGRCLVRGSAQGRSMKLAAPISLWGGIDPVGGRVADPRHPNHECCISDRVLVIPATIGSSSSSAIMLELLRLGTAPAAILLGEKDAILVLGLLVAEELGYQTIPVIELERSQLAEIPEDAEVIVTEHGEVHY